MVEVADKPIEKRQDPRGTTDSVSTLSTRETEIARLYVSGQTYKEIADQLFIAPTTVRNHISTIYRKLGIGSKAELEDVLALDRDHQNINVTYPDKPSIAVLPFTNMSGDPEWEYFADGFTDDIITSLSRIVALFVIARNSSFVYKGRNIDSKQIAEELDVRYILEGSIRRLSDRYRLNAQLIDARANHNVWVETFNTPHEELHDSQDEIIRSIAAAVQTQITLHEGEVLSVRPREDQRTEDLLKRAWNRIYQMAPTALQEAIKFAEEVLSTVPNSDRAFQILAIGFHHLAYLGYADNWEEMVTCAHNAATRAVELFEFDEYSHWILGSTLVLMCQHDRAVAEYARAIEINPNCSMAYGSLGTALAWAGKSDEAIRNNEIAMRSNPQDPSIFLRFFVQALAHFTAERYVEAEHWATKALQRKNTFHYPHLVRIASLALMGQIDSAMLARGEMERLFPQTRVSALGHLPFIRAQDRDNLEQGLRTTGL